MVATSGVLTQSMEKTRAKETRHFLVKRLHLDGLSIRDRSNAGLEYAFAHGVDICQNGILFRRKIAEVREKTSNYFVTIREGREEYTSKLEAIFEDLDRFCGTSSEVKVSLGNYR